MERHPRFKKNYRQGNLHFRCQKPRRPPGFSFPWKLGPNASEGSRLPTPVLDDGGGGGVFGSGIMKPFHVEILNLLEILEKV